MFIAYTYSRGIQQKIFCIFMNFIVFSMNIQILHKLTGNLNRKIYLEKNEKVETMSGLKLQCRGWQPATVARPAQSARVGEL
jgi:hypothetical protein